MLILVLGDRVVALVCTALAILLAGGTRSLAAIPGQDVQAWTLGATALVAGLAAVEFALRCPVLTRIAARTAGRARP